MANVLNRTTLQFLTSVNTPDYPVIDWVINPDMSPVEGVPSKYWKLTGDIVSEMTQPEKDAVDAALAAALLLSEAEESQTGEFETPSAVPVTVLSIAPTNSFLEGEYRIDWFCVVKQQSNRGLIRLRLVVDSVTEFETPVVDPKKWISQSGFLNVTWSEAVHQVDLQIYSSVEGRAVQMKNAKLKVKVETVNG